MNRGRHDPIDECVQLTTRIGGSILNLKKKKKRERKECRTLILITETEIKLVTRESAKKPSYCYSKDFQGPLLTLPPFLPLPIQRDSRQK